MKKLYLLFVIVLIIVSSASANTIHVPGDHRTIQAGVLASHDGDTVLVANGRYTGFGNRGIDFQGREIVIIAENGPENCIIDLENLTNYAALFVHSGEGSNSVFSGFKIVNGNYIGGALRIEASSPTIDNCIISECLSYAVNLWQSTSLITNCIIQNCQNMGVVVSGGNSTLSGCLFTGINNQAVHIDIGSINLEKCSVIECSWAIHLEEAGNIRAKGCTFYNTGGIYAWSNSYHSLLLENNIFDGIVLSIHSIQCVADYNCFNNMGNIIIEPYIPVGVINRINANGDSCDIYSNIFLNPSYISTTGDSAFRLTENSPCIDAGNPLSHVDPDITIADIGRFYFDQRMIQITMTPLNPPIQIPAGGGSFQYDILITNLSETNVLFDAWIEAVLPDNSLLSPIRLKRNLVLEPFGSLEYQSLTQSVPANAPSGTYTYSAFIGTNPDIRISSDNFDFEKLPGDGIANHQNGWKLFGWDDESELTVNIAENYNMIAAYPNPFNPSTTISFELGEAGLVSMDVFDITGRAVGAKNLSPLQNQWMSAGQHSVVFDAEGLSSGIYFIRLEAGEFRQTQKILLLK